MNVEQAKQIDLRDFMSRQGYQPTKIKRGGRELFYKAPWRNEKEGSLHAMKLPDGIWVWNDLGEGAEGGSIIDMVMRLKGGGVKEALVTLSKIYQGSLFDYPTPSNQPSFSFQRSRAAGAQNFQESLGFDSSLEFVGVKPLQSPLIFQYLKSRGIGQQLAKEYLQLVHYRNKKKPSKRPYFAFGQRNLSKGWEIRSANDGSGKFKSALIKRDITVHRGTQQGRRGVCVFEGMIDHLSLLTRLNTLRLKGDALILNAISSYGRAQAYIAEQDYDRIDLFLDNNEGGQKTTARFKDDFGELVTDHSPMYAPHVDLNDALRARFHPTFSLDYTTPKP